RTADPGPRCSVLRRVRGTQELLQQPHQVRLLRARHLLRRALPRRLVRPPAQQTWAVAEPAAGEMIVADLDHELRLERLPLRRALGRPAARAAGLVAGEAGRADQLFELLGQRFLLAALHRRGEADMVEQARVVVEPKQQRADRLLAFVVAE